MKLTCGLMVLVVFGSSPAFSQSVKLPIEDPAVSAPCPNCFDIMGIKLRSACASVTFPADYEISTENFTTITGVGDAGPFVKTIVAKGGPNNWSDHVTVNCSNPFVGSVVIGIERILTTDSDDRADGMGALQKSYKEKYISDFALVSEDTAISLKVSKVLGADGNPLKIDKPVRLRDVDFIKSQNIAEIFTLDLSRNGATTTSKSSAYDIAVEGKQQEAERRFYMGQYKATVSQDAPLVSPPPSQVPSETMPKL